MLAHPRTTEQRSDGGTLTQRLVKRQERELGIKQEDQDISTKVHLVADAEHSDLLNEVFTRHVIDKSTVEQVLRGAEESLAIERCFHGAIATAMGGIGLRRPLQLSS